MPRFHGAAPRAGWGLILAAFSTVAASELRVRWVAGDRSMALGQPIATNAHSQVLTLTRADIILSQVALHRPGAGWIIQSNWVGVFQAGTDDPGVPMAGLPAADYDRLRIDVGLAPHLNERDAATWPPEHPLNPARSGLHWGWSGGWVFAAIEGRWSDATRPDGGFSLHLGTQPLRGTIERPLRFHPSSGADIEVAFDVARLFSRGAPRFDEGTATTHSRAGDTNAAPWMARLLDSARVDVVKGKGSGNPPGIESSASSGALGIAPGARPYRLVVPGTFPRPALPMDNPLTEEGVALGRRLFHDPLLSRGERYSCASCHDPGRAFTDAKAVSTGVSGRPGTRSAMPLFNLAWKTSFFWDGRARTLREQVIQPITHPDEMGETMPSVVAKLRRGQGEGSYAEGFRRAFGTSEVNAGRIALALEQFLLVQVSGNSRFDRALRGEVELTPMEARGFELFRTENDPSRGLRGADCFHCHGGSLFQSQRFGNNGLSSAFADRGRAGVTGRPSDEGLFAVPSLRNVALTAPYMHDGRLETLEEVVAHYSKGVQPSPTLDPNLAKHPRGGLQLDVEDQRALVAFLQTLTDAQPRGDGDP